MSGEPPPRVRVTAPATARRRRTTVIGELDAQSPIGEIYLRSLLRSQLRLALTATLVLVLTVGALPLLFVTVPPLRHAHLVVWLLLGAGCYPVLIGLAIVYTTRAERNERVFGDLVTPGSAEATVTAEATELAE